MKRTKAASPAKPTKPTEATRVASLFPELEGDVEALVEEPPEEPLVVEAPLEPEVVLVLVAMPDEPDSWKK